MNQIASALSHYWQLRAQGVLPDAARAHVRQRFGVELGDLPSPEESGDVVGPVAPAEGTYDWRTIYGSSTGPRDGLRMGR